MSSDNNNNTNNEQPSYIKQKIQNYLDENPQPKYVNVPVFLNKEMPISTFFLTSGALASFGFFIGIVLGTRKSGGLKNTIRNSPPGTVQYVAKALLGGTALCLGTTGLGLYALKKYHNIETVDEFGKFMSHKLLGIEPKKNLVLVQQDTNINNNNDSEDLDEDIRDVIGAVWKPENDIDNKNE